MPECLSDAGKAFGIFEMTAMAASIVMLMRFILFSKIGHKHANIYCLLTFCLGNTCLNRLHIFYRQCVPPISMWKKQVFNLEYYGFIIQIDQIINDAQFA